VAHQLRNSGHDPQEARPGRAGVAPPVTLLPDARPEDRFEAPAGWSSASPAPSRPIVGGSNRQAAVMPHVFWGLPRSRLRSVHARVTVRHRHGATPQRQAQGSTRQRARGSAGPVPQAVWAPPPRVPTPARAERAPWAATRVGRRSPADRLSSEFRSRRRARPRLRLRPHRRSRPRARPRRASRRLTRAAAKPRCSRTASGSRSSCLPSEPCRQTTRRRLPVRAPASGSTSRCRCPGAGPPYTASRDRRRTVGAPGRRPATSRPER
jgi:hypothetical protein